MGVPNKASAINSRLQTHFRQQTVRALRDEVLNMHDSNSEGIF
jgi:hypothetical protein